MWDRYEALKMQGVEGWWCDLGEPEIHPDTMVHSRGKAVDVHGLYGHEWTKVFYDNYRKYYPNERLFILGRAGYAGTQKYGLIPWSGDVGRTWSGLQAQIPVMLGMGLSGLSFMHSDAGGFAMHSKNEELYLRWCQFAAFTPIYRPHSDPNAPSEPIFYNDSVQDVVKKYIQLRYQLLPYNYSIMYRNHIYGTPLAKSLFMKYNDSDLAANDSVYFWGENILIAPVLRAGVKTQKVALPSGAWFNMHNGEYLKGNQIVEIKCGYNDIPVLIKAGSFIPMASNISNTRQYTSDTLIVHYYHSKGGSHSEYTLYLDDGVSFGSYDNGNYETIDFACKNEEITIVNRGGNYPGRPQSRVINIILYTENSMRVSKEVTLNQNGKYTFNITDLK